MLETRTFRRIIGETPIDSLESREKQKNYQRLVYVVHPSASEGGDVNEIVKDQIQDFVDTKIFDGRIILIAPPEETIYLNRDFKPTDIRSDVDERDWVERSDINPRVSKVTLIGGNLERCLGSVYQSLIMRLVSSLQAEQIPEHVIEVELPLSAIYMMDGVTAEQMLQLLSSESNDLLLSIIALLTSPISYSSRLGYGNFEVINSSGNGKYKLLLNDNLIASLDPLQEEEIELPEGWSHREKEIGFKDVTVVLKLTGSIPDSSNQESNINSRKILGMLEHASKTVLANYDVSRD